MRSAMPSACSSDAGQRPGRTVRIDRRTFLAASGAAATLPLLGACGGPRRIPDPDVPQSRFGAKSTADEVTAGIDLRGKLAVVTGCTSGIGFETLRVLASRGAYVVGTGRTHDKAKAACARVVGKTTPVALELSDLESVVECAEVLNTLNAPIDILVCNAGMRRGGNRRELVNGVEQHFAVNHLGHFVLVNRLLENMYCAWQGRIVVVASRSAYRSAPAAGIEFDNLDARRGYSDASAYGQSKLANVLFAQHLGKLLRGTRITSNALHPGVINTEIDRNLNRVAQWGFAAVTSLGAGKTIAQGAATTCYVATNPLLGSTSGKYFEDCNAVKVLGDHHLHDAAMAERLWDVSTDLARDYLATLEMPDCQRFRRRFRDSEPTAEL